jgi:hypothetical protein
MQANLRVCMVVVTFLAAASAASAQILNPRVTITGSTSDVSAQRTFVVNGNNYQTQYATGARGKARLTLDLTRHFSVEGVYGFGTSNLDVTRPGSTPQTGAFGVREHEVQVNVMHYFTASATHLRPFLSTGVGVARFTPTSAAKTQASFQFIDSPATISPDNKLSVTIAGGLEARSRHRIGLRLDVMDHISGIPTYGLPQNSSGTGGASYPVSGIVHNIQVEAGLVFYLWRLE